VLFLILRKNVLRNFAGAVGILPYKIAGFLAPVIRIKQRRAQLFVMPWQRTANFQHGIASCCIPFSTEFCPEDHARGHVVFEETLTCEVPKNARTSWKIHRKNGCFTMAQW
jgi:hypothetical protein